MWPCSLQKLQKRNTPGDCDRFKVKLLAEILNLTQIWIKSYSKHVTLCLLWEYHFGVRCEILSGEDHLLTAKHWALVQILPLDCGQFLSWTLGWGHRRTATLKTTRWAFDQIDNMNYNVIKLVQVTAEKFDFVCVALFVCFGIKF